MPAGLSYRKCTEADRRFEKFRKGGGVAHGPHPRSYHKAMPRKMRRLAVRSALSAKYAADEIRFVDTLSFEQPRTKDMLACLSSLELDGKTLIEYNEPAVDPTGRGKKLGEGTFALQAHDPKSIVRYKNIRVKRLE